MQTFFHFYSSLEMENRPNRLRNKVSRVGTLNFGILSTALRRKFERRYTRELHWAAALLQARIGLRRYKQ
jgi:hypothetical protein